MRKLRLGRSRALAVVAGISLLASAASATVIVESTLGTRKAKAEFTVSGSGSGRQLTVQLSNTSNNDVMAPIDVLTSVYFATAGGTFAFTPVSANVAAGSSIFFENPAFGGTDIGGEWCYKSGLDMFSGHADRGIGSAGFGIFGPPDLFGGPDRNNKQAPDGLDYAILSQGDNTTTGNTPVTGGFELIKSSAVFVFSVSASFAETNINQNSVVFQYGTALSDPHHGPGDEVPEPAALGLVGLGALAFVRRRTR